MTQPFPQSEDSRTKTEEQKNDNTADDNTKESGAIVGENEEDVNQDESEHKSSDFNHRVSVFTNCEDHKNNLLATLPCDQMVSSDTPGTSTSTGTTHPDPDTHLTNYKHYVHKKFRPACGH